LLNCLPLNEFVFERKIIRACFRLSLLS
jgi:hypothetical protein